MCQQIVKFTIFKCKCLKIISNKLKNKTNQNIRNYNKLLTKKLIKNKNTLQQNRQTINIKY